MIKKLAPEEREILNSHIKTLSSDLEKVTKESELDALTGAKTRQYGKNKGLMEIIETKDPRGRIKKTFKLADRETRLKNGYDDVATFDLDGFKTRINDAFGHNVGDDVLIDYFAILDKHLGKYGDVMRVGGDEGLFIKFAKSKKEDILRATEAARKELREVVFADGKLTDVNFTAGYGKDFIPADQQLLKAKKAGRGVTFEGGKQYGLQPDRPSGLAPGGEGADTGALEKGGTVTETGTAKPEAPKPAEPAKLEPEKKPGEELLSFPQTVKEKGEGKVAPATKLTYKPQTHAETEKKATEIIKQRGPEGSVKWLHEEQKPSAEHTAVAMKMSAYFQ
ncbi:MAG TPA: GGDEF domain-containing protein, partial [Clostridia bacterium]|nr:GGDEF domain-containing protein [Clostridia bacterium]